MPHAGTCRRYTRTLGMFCLSVGANWVCVGYIDGKLSATEQDKNELIVTRFKCDSALGGAIIVTRWMNAEGSNATIKINLSSKLTGSEQPFAGTIVLEVDTRASNGYAAHRLELLKDRLKSWRRALDDPEEWDIAPTMAIAIPLAGEIITNACDPLPHCYDILRPLPLAPPPAVYSPSEPPSQVLHSAPPSSIGQANSLKRRRSSDVSPKDGSVAAEAKRAKDKGKGKAMEPLIMASSKALPRRMSLRATRAISYAEREDSDELLDDEEAETSPASTSSLEGSPPSIGQSTAPRPTLTAHFHPDSDAFVALTKQFQVLKSVVRSDKAHNQCEQNDLHVQLEELWRAYLDSQQILEKAVVEIGDLQRELGQTQGRVKELERGKVSTARAAATNSLGQSEINAKRNGGAGGWATSHGNVDAELAKLKAKIEPTAAWMRAQTSGQGSTGPGL